MSWNPVLVLVLIVLSGFADSLGFVYAARIWQAGQLSWPDVGRSALGWAVGITLYVVSLKYMARLGVSISDMDTPVANLSGGQRQAVAISRALRWNAELIVMDEPTAALGVKETAQVLDLIRRLKADGKTIILVSHNMADVVAVASRVAILKSGRKVIDRAVAGLDADTLAHMVMTGKDSAAN